MVLGVVVLVATAVLWPQLAQEYILTVRAPSLEQKFGFHGEYVGRAYVLTEVTNGGRLHQAGFRAGDHPSVGICRFYGDYVSAEAFLDDLDHVQAGHTVEFTVARGRGGTLEFVRLTLPASAHQSER
jgi:predicted metalloprotease with PDZ domain